MHPIPSTGGKVKRFLKISKKGYPAAGEYDILRSNLEESGGWKEKPVRRKRSFRAVFHRRFS